jgi:CxxC motif-containing protein (DUF1111 family)
MTNLLILAGRALLPLFLVLIFAFPVRAVQPVPHKSKAERFLPRSGARPEGPSKYFYIEGITTAVPDASIKPAPTGYDNLTNGYAPQGPPFNEIDDDNVVPTRSFNDGRFVFEETEQPETGLGPIYNGQRCSECHQNVVTGGASQVTILRTGHTDDDGMFFESQGGSLIQARATDPGIIEHVVDSDETRAFRISPAALGDGFVECISDSTIDAIRDAQPEAMRGSAPEVPVLEGDGSARYGRFGWKCQHGSLVSFAADAYANEMGITSALFPDENTSSGMFVGYGTKYDPLPEPEDTTNDVAGFAFFIRSTKAPARGEITNAVRTGEKRFNAVGCNICHVSTIATATAGTPINGGAFQVPPALGDKTIHPYSDFLLHDVGTGDGIPIQPLPQYAETAHQIRTAPLWGLRTRNRLMHDGLSLTLQDAIERHAGQAAGVIDQFNGLTDTDKQNIYAFLGSL